MHINGYWILDRRNGYDKTLAQMTDEERENRVKYKSVDSLEEFAKWYKNKEKGSKNTIS